MRDIDFTTGGRMSDDAIIDLYLQRDEKAIRRTEEAYGPYLMTIARHILEDRLDSEECVNDTYLATWNAIPPARPHNFKAFLSQIVRRISINRYEANHASRRVPSEHTVSLEEMAECMSDSGDLQSEAVQKDIIAALNRFLRTLDERDRNMFICRYYFADSVKEIAQMLSVSESAVYKQLTVLRERLRAYLRKEGYDRI